MSHYTTEVRFLCETYAGFNHSLDYPSIDNVVEAARSKIFGDYPIFDENYRGILERKILKHYYTREISAETVGLWKLWLNNKMNEIMPYYNQLYKSETLEFNPFYDIDYTRDYRRSGNEDTTGSSAAKEIRAHDSSSYTSDTERLDSTTDTSDSATSWNLFQDTPAGGLTGVENLSYLTNATKNTDEREGYTGVVSDNARTSNTRNRIDEANDNSSNYTGNVKNLEDYIERVKGVHGGSSYSKKLDEFRKTFLNIDLEIIKDLRSLFFYLW